MDAAELLIAANLALTRSLGLDETLGVLLDYLARAVPYDTGEVLLLEDEAVLVPHALRGYELWPHPEQLLGMRLDVVAAPQLHALVEGRQSVLIADTATCPGWSCLPHTAYVRSWLGAPLIAGGKLVGVCSLAKTEPGGLTPEHRRLAEMLAAPAALAIQNVRLGQQVRSQAEALREGEERFRILSEAAFEGLLIHSQGRILRLNRAAARMLGYEGQELVGRSLLELVAPESLGVAGQRLNQVQDQVLELVLLRKDRAPILVEAAGHTMPLEGRSVRALCLRDVTQRRHAQDTLRRSEQRFRALIENSADSIALMSQDGRIEYGSPATTRVLGYGLSEFVGRNAFDLIHPEDLEFVRIRLTESLARPAVGIELQARVLHKDGSWRLLQGVFTNLLADPSVGALVANYRDVTEHGRLEQQLRHSQKMEAVGQLAGGVAHDFNNLLMIILGHVEMVLAGMPAADPARRKIEQVRRAAQRAATLTRQLLAFSRKQVIAPVSLDLNAVLAGMESMLRRLIGEDIDVVLIPDRGLRRILADPGQVEQVLLNLVLNARDAMPRGGRLGFETANLELSAETTWAHPGVRPGSYVVLTLSDTGCGIDEATLAHIFEPFFTTKQPGKGTGLGLATVYGIVQQAGGHIRVDSQPGRGTTFTMYLPSTDSAPTPAEAARAAAAGGSETILLVEDEQLVRELVHEMLAGAGYTVLEARHAGEALEIATRYRDRIHLLITDVIMPQTNGVDLARSLVALRPGLAVLYISGYTDDAIAQHGELSADTYLLEKPFTQEELSCRVREVLDAARPALAAPDGPRAR